MNNEDFDIVVIGSGVIGHSIAFRLNQDDPQLKIAVLGDSVNSLQASRAAAGMLAPFCECDQADTFFSFCRESLDKFPKFLAELFFSQWFSRTFLTCRVFDAFVELPRNLGRAKDIFCS